MFQIAASAYGNTKSTRECAERIRETFGVVAQHRYHSLENACPMNKPCAVVIVVISPDARHPNGEVIIAFEGTNTYTKLVWQAIGSQKSFVDFYEGKGQVNGYYLAALEMHWKYIAEILNLYKGYNVTFTGHSKGGALAAMAALYYSLLQEKQIKEDYWKGMTHRNKIQSHSFGEPRHGNTAYAFNHNKYVPLSYRYVNRMDGVPHLPPCTIDLTGHCDEKNPKAFFHQGYEFWFDKGMEPGKNPIISAMESMSGSNSAFLNSYDIQSLWALSTCVTDHQVYFGKNVYDFGASGCKSP